VPQPISVLIADDHPVVRHGLSTMLEIEEDIAVVARAKDGLEAVEAAREHRPDVALIDVQMPRLDGIEALRRIAQVAPETRVIMLTTFDNDEYVLPSLKAGARGYLLKDVGRDELVQAIRTVAQGGSLRAARAPAVAGEGLTEREREVLLLVADGLSNREIAERLVVSEKTVKTHVSNLLQKLGAPSRTAAVAIARKRGILG
jgi:DNA-binding NarL/FixJ family response regulator